MTSKVGVCTVFWGNGEILGTPAGRQNPSGSSLLKLSLRSFKRAAAHGCRSKGPPELLKFAGDQTPCRSTLPSGIRGVGPEGTALPLPPPFWPPPPGPTGPNFPPLSVLA